MADFKQLMVWQKAHRATLEIYRCHGQISGNGVVSVNFADASLCVSVGSNSAEGRGRDGDPDFSRFIEIAAGSATELEYQLLVAKDLGYLPESEHTKLNTNLAEVGRMLISLRESVRSASAAS
jgi:four helix bundle protein